MRMVEGNKLCLTDIVDLSHLALHQGSYCKFDGDSGPI